MSIIFEPYQLNSGSFALHRRPRLRLADRPTVFALRRQPRLAMSGTATTHVSMPLRQPPPALRMSDRQNVFVLHRPPQLAMAGAAPLPTASVFVLGSPGHALTLTTTITTHASLALHQQPTLLMSDAAARFALRCVPHLFLSDGHVSMDRTGFLLQQPELVSSMVEGITKSMQAGFSVTPSTYVAQLTYRLHAAMALLGVTSPLAQLTRRLDSALGLHTVVDLALYLRATSAVSVSGTPTNAETLLLVLADTLALLGGASSLQEADQLLATIFALADAADTPLAEVLLSSLSVRSTLGVDVTAYAQALAALRLAATAGGTLLLTAVLADSFVFGDTPTTLLELLRTLQSAIGATATLQLGDQVYTAWVMDAQSKAVWSYENYPFNSFAQLGDRFFAAGPDGISELVGGDDAGTPINWSAQTGLLNFGTSFEKRIDTAYIGYTSEGTVGLSVISTSSDGEKVQYNYTMVPRNAAAPRENRIKIGRGTKSVYFAFEFAGTGAFALSDAQVLPMILGRRV